MSENQEAQALARWLEEHPGQAPPPDVDPEVIEALYALRPDLAPAPTLSIDDIFDAIESGPFRPSGDEVTVVSLAAERAKRVQHDAEPASEPPVAKRRVPWWAVPGAGALAAAALALVVILPTAGVLITQKQADLEGAPPAAVEAAAPASLPAAAAPAREQAPADATAPKQDEDVRLRQEEKRKVYAPSGGVGADENLSGLVAPAEPARPSSFEPSAAARDAESAQPALIEEYDALEKSAGAKLEDAAPAKELQAYGESAGASTSTYRADDRAKDAKKSAPAPSVAAAAEAEAPAPNGPAPYDGISASSTDVALTAATDDSDDRKAMTAAWFLADRQYDRGDADAAMATIAKGLRRAGNDDLRSDLMALQWTVAQSTSPAILDAAPATDQ